MTYSTRIKYDLEDGIWKWELLDESGNILTWGSGGTLQGIEWQSDQALEQYKHCEWVEYKKAEPKYKL